MSAGLTAGVIGCGRMGAFTSPSVREFGPACFLPSAHAEAIEEADGLDLVAVCDANEEGAARAGEHYGVTRRYTDHRALLSEGAPDIMGIATRTIGRADIIADCIEAGTRALHVEKPICNSVEELGRLETLMARDNVFVTLGAVRRHFAIYQHAVEQAWSGAHGELMDIVTEFGLRSLYWSHPHMVDLILFAARGAKIASVQATLGTVEREGSRIINDPDVLSALIHFENGLIGYINRMPGTDFRLGCATGKLAVTSNGGNLWFSGVTDPDSTNPYHEPQLQEFAAPDMPQGALAPMLQLVACLNGDSEAQAANAVIKRDIITGQRILFAIVQSHLEGGRPVALDAVDPEMFIEGRTGQFAA